MAIFLYVIIAYISVFIHEFGHYISAYYFKVKATHVITGMGFKLFSIQTKSTHFIFNILPGGGVTIYDPNDERKLSIFHQIIVLLSGVTLNYFTAVICASLYIDESLMKGFYYLNHLMITFIHNIFSMLTLKDLIFPSHSFNESIQMIAQGYTLKHYILFIFIFMNLLLFLFNLIPIPFFDGGQIVSLLLDPLFIKLGVKATTLEALKEYINQATGYVLILLILLPFIGRGYLFITSSPNPKSEILKWILIILGSVLIKRIFQTITCLLKSEH